MFTLLMFKVIIDREGFVVAVLLFSVGLIVFLSFNRGDELVRAHHGRAVR